MVSLNKTKIFRFHPLIRNRLISRESSTVEFKESFNWSSKDKYAKTMSAFANNKGGVLVFGVRNNPRELVGIQGANFENIDEAKITEYLNSVFVPEIQFEKYTDTIRRKQVGILKIHPSIKKPVISIKNDRVLKESEIYYRYIARSEKIKYPELQSILEEEKEKIEEKWRNLLNNLGRISDIGQVTMLNEDSGQPMRITDDPNAPVVRIEEDPTIGGFILRYRDITIEMHKRSKSFKQNDKFHKLMRKLKKKEELCRIRFLYPNNPDSTKAQFFHPKILDELEKHY